MIKIFKNSMSGSELTLEYMLTCKVGVIIIRYLDVKGVLNCSGTCKVIRSKLFSYALEHYFFGEQIIEDYHEHVKKLYTRNIDHVNKCTSLTHLTFEDKFNQKVDNLGSLQNLKHL